MGDSFGSLLGVAFNNLWADALKAVKSDGITHFAMLHDDCVPDPWWIDTLIDEADRLDAAVVSAVVAFKDRTGLTSTALIDPSDPWAPNRRLTLHEVQNSLPDTFNAQDCIAIDGEPGQCLGVNTGCWVADLRKLHWWDLDDTGALRHFFTVRDRVVPDGDDFKVLVEPEDWGFSRRLQQDGHAVYATSKVAVTHHGCAAFPSNGPCGPYKTDKVYARVIAERDHHVLA